MKAFSHSLQPQKERNSSDDFAGQQTKNYAKLKSFMRIYGILKWEFSVDWTAYGCLTHSLNLHALLYAFIRHPHSCYCSLRTRDFLLLPEKYLSWCQQKILNQRHFDGIICFTWVRKNCLSSQRSSAALCFSSFNVVSYNTRLLLRKDTQFF
jgi:hypothetical protein